MKPMKTRIVLFLLVALLTAAALVPAGEAAPPVLRLHIRANSDDAADQAVKLRVRDALLPLFEAADTYEDARSFVLSHGAALLETCRAVLTAAGVPYGAQLLLGVSDFPDRTYNGARFPAGPYDALEVVLGDGAGHNWWCVLFPPLCVVTRDGSSPDAAPDPQAGFTFESDILALFRKWFGEKTPAVPMESGGRMRAG